MPGARRSWQPSRPPPSHPRLLPAWTLLLPLQGCSSSPARLPRTLRGHRVAPGDSCWESGWLLGAAWPIPGKTPGIPRAELGWHRAGCEAPPGCVCAEPRGISLPEQQLCPCLPAELPNPSFFRGISDTPGQPLLPAGFWVVSIPGPGWALLPPQSLLVAGHPQPGACAGFSSGSWRPRPGRAGPSPASREQGTDSGGSSECAAVPSHLPSPAINPSRAALEGTEAFLGHGSGQCHLTHPGFSPCPKIPLLLWLRVASCQLGQHWVALGSPQNKMSRNPWVWMGIQKQEQGPCSPQEP